MTLYEKLLAANLIDKRGLVTLVGQPEGSDNGTLYSAYYFLLCSKIGEPIDTNHVSVLHAIGACVNNGNPVRYPGCTDLNSPDNLIGVAFAAHTFAEQIYDYGWPIFNYNTTNPGKFTLSSWIGRQLGLIGFVQYAAKGWINPIRLLALYVGIWITSRNPLDQTSDRLLAHLMLEYFGDVWWNKAFRAWWKRTLRLQYKNGINDVASLYFGPYHVFSQEDWS